MQNFSMPLNNLPVLASAYDINLLGHMNKQYVDAETIGRKLGYADPYRAISRLYLRHKKEFKEGETSVVKLTTEVKGSSRSKSGHLQQVEFRLFAVPKGVFRICMLADAPNRVDVQDEILNLFDTFRFGAMLKAIPEGMPTAISGEYIKEIKLRLGAFTGNRLVKDLFSGCFDGETRFMSLEEMAKMPDGTVRAAAVNQYATDKGITTQAAYRQINRYRQAFGITKPVAHSTGKPRRSPCTKGTFKKAEEHEKLLSYLKTHPEYLSNKGCGRHIKYPKKHLKSILGLSVSTGQINKWIRDI